MWRLNLCEINNTLLVSVGELYTMRFKVKAITRRRFLQAAGATVLLAVVAAPAIGGGKSGHGVKRVRVRPLSLQGGLSPRENDFFRRARFFTAADAMRAVASRRMTAEVYRE